MSIDIEAYYRRYAPMVLRRCRSLMRDEDSAMDMMQEVFASVLRNKHKLTDTAPSSLLYTIATNLCLNAIKSRRLRSDRQMPMTSRDDGEIEIPWHDRSFEKTDAKDVLDRIFAQDDEKTRTIAWLHYVDRMTLEETAEQVGMSVSGIRKRLKKLQSIGTGEVHR